MKALLDFLFGKDADIFDPSGRVHHNFPKKKWDDWKNRYIKSDDYNWRAHAGTQAGASKSEIKPESQKLN